MAGDAAAYLALWSEEMVIHLPGREEPIAGKAAYAKMIDESMAEMRPIAWEFHSIAIDGERVLAEWTIKGEYIKASKAVSWRGMSICTIRDGLIVHWREYWDPAALRL
ncbi:MAG: nuclear transport factor 2 family protein [Deltaproteobacteria bacterium]|nr:nuclear transport factor 2 family protein [Deltaproteobacteria bacterium]